MRVEVIFEDVRSPVRIFGKLMNDISLGISLHETARRSTDSGFSLSAIEYYVEATSHTPHVRNEKAPKIESVLIEFKQSESTIVMCLPIRFRADLICY